MGNACSSEDNKSSSKQPVHPNLQSDHSRGPPLQNRVPPAPPIPQKEQHHNHHNENENNNNHDEKNEKTSEKPSLEINDKNKEEHPNSSISLEPLTSAEIEVVSSAWKDLMTLNHPLQKNNNEPYNDHNDVIIDDDDDGSFIGQEEQERILNMINRFDNNRKNKNDSLTSKRTKNGDVYYVSSPNDNDYNYNKKNKSSKKNGHEADEDSDEPNNSDDDNAADIKNIPFPLLIRRAVRDCVKNDKTTNNNNNRINNIEEGKTKIVQKLLQSYYNFVSANNEDGENETKISNRQTTQKKDEVILLDGRKANELLSNLDQQILSAPIPNQDLMKALETRLFGCAEEDQVNSQSAHSVIDSLNNEILLLTQQETTTMMDSVLLRLAKRDKSLVAFAQKSICFVLHQIVEETVSEIAEDEIIYENERIRKERTENFRIQRVILDEVECDGDRKKICIEESEEWRKIVEVERKFYDRKQKEAEKAAEEDRKLRERAMLTMKNKQKQDQEKRDREELLLSLLSPSSLKKNGKSNNAASESQQSSLQNQQTKSTEKNHEEKFNETANIIDDTNDDDDDDQDISESAEALQKRRAIANSVLDKLLDAMAKSSVDDTDADDEKALQSEKSDENHSNRQSNTRNINNGRLPSKTTTTSTCEHKAPSPQRQRDYALKVLSEVIEERAKSVSRSRQQQENNNNNNNNNQSLRTPSRQRERNLQQQQQQQQDQNLLETQSLPSRRGDSLTPVHHHLHSGNRNAKNKNNEYYYYNQSSASSVSNAAVERGATSTASQMNELPPMLSSPPPPPPPASNLKNKREDNAFSNTNNNGSGSNNKQPIAVSSSSSSLFVPAPLVVVEYEDYQDEKSDNNGREKQPQQHQDQEKTTAAPLPVLPPTTSVVASTNSPPPQNTNGNGQTKKASSFSPPRWKTGNPNRNTTSNFPFAVTEKEQEEILELIEQETWLMKNGKADSDSDDDDEDDDDWTELQTSGWYRNAKYGYVFHPKTSGWFQNEKTFEWVDTEEMTKRTGIKW